MRITLLREKWRRCTIDTSLLQQHSQEHMVLETKCAFSLIHELLLLMLHYKYLFCCLRLMIIWKTAAAIEKPDTIDIGRTL